MPNETIIIGGGVIGLSLAYELAGRGRAVRVLEQGPLGREASWAGAGILPPGNLEMAATPEAQLRALSSQLWPNWSRTLRNETDIDNGYIRCGSIELRTADSTQTVSSGVDRWTREGVFAEPLSSGQLKGFESRLNPEIAEGYRLPDTSQVRNPRHLKALIAGCSQRRVTLQVGQSVTGFQIQNGRVKTVLTAAGRFSAEAVCITAGAWSRQLLEPLGIALPIVPMRGQIVLFGLPAPIFRHILECGPRYLVPRPDGRVLVGSTEERAGFDKRNTASAIRDLIEFAVNLVPELKHATVERTWAGLRPCSADGLPFLGLLPETENLYVAAGHFRSGLQMSPGTAVVMADLISGRTSPIDLTPFAVGRSTVDSRDDTE